MAYPKKLYIYKCKLFIPLCGVDVDRWSESGVHLRKLEEPFRLIHMPLDCRKETKHLEKTGMVRTVQTGPVLFDLQANHCLYALLYISN